MLHVCSPHFLQISGVCAFFISIHASVRENNMLGAYPLQKRRKRRGVSSFFSSIVRRYDLREVDGVPRRVFDVYPVAAEHAVIEIQRLRARHCGDAHGGAVVFVHAVAIVAARARRAAAVVESQPHVVAAKCAARGVDPAAEAAVSADLPVFKRAAVQERSLARRKADARAVAHKADVRDV